ncbi:NlpC/P60 family protein [Streptomyces sp. NPDC042638]|uniref:C40 family peptidase n=1 Tax=Streptomyces sp. NPDC042638 TaxID=3154333 RepID=UPI0034083C18
MAPESRDEVRQRIDSLYDQAENATGNFNATRAMALRARSRGVPLAKRPTRRPDPALTEITRQWFDTARGKFGPTVPAVLPADRLPAPAPERPATSVRALDPGRGALVGGERAALGPAPAAPAPQALERGADGAPAALRAAGAPAEPTAPSPMDLLPVEAPTGGWMTAPATEPTQLAGTTTGSTGGLAATPDTPHLPGLWEPGAPGGTPQASPLPLHPLPIETPTGGWMTAPTTEPTQLAGTTTGSTGGLTAPTGTPHLLGLWEPGTSGGAPEASPLPLHPLPIETPTGGWMTAPTTEPTQLAGTTTESTSDLAATPDTPHLPGLWAPGAVGGAPVASALLPAPPLSRADGDRVRMPRPLPGAAGFGGLAPAVAKAAGRRKLATTGELLARHTMRPGLPAQPAPAADLTPAGQANTGTGTFTYQAPPASVADTGPVPRPAVAPAAQPATAVLTGAVVPESPRASRAARAIAFARAQIGKPCVWGATGPDSYDCSSLTQAAWRAAGVTLPRAAHEQALSGTPVTTAGIEPGDLVLFFEDDRHVGLHVGGGMMVHAPGPGSTIREESIYGAGEAAIRRIVRPA